MRSATPKVLHEIGGRSLVGHAVAAADVLGADRLVVVIGHGRDAVAAHLAAVAPHVRTAVQDEQLGTGHAVQCALESAGDVTGGTVVVTYGDVPLLTGETLAELVAQHAGDGNAATVLTARVADPTGYGRIVRADDGSVAGIVEHRDATAEQLTIDEINSGIYAFDGRVLVDALAQLRPDNDQGELYLTDVLALARAGGGRVAALVTEDVWQTEGVNDRVQLAAMRRELNRRVVEALDARRGHGGRSGHDLGGRHRRARPGRDPRARDAAAGEHPHRRRGAGRPGHAAGRLRGRAGGARDPHARDLGADRRGRPGGPVHVPAARDRPGGAGQGRGVRGDQELRGGPGLEGAAPVLRGRRHDRCGLQHRRGHRLRQLRRRGQARHGRRRRGPDRLGHHARRPGDDRRRGLHRGRIGHHRGRPAGGAGPGAGPSAHRRGLGPGASGGDGLGAGGSAGRPESGAPARASHDPGRSEACSRSTSA